VPGCAHPAPRADWLELRQQREEHAVFSVGETTLKAPRPGKPCARAPPPPARRPFLGHTARPVGWAP